MLLTIYFINKKSLNMFLIIPLPPTDNQLRIPSRGRLVKSKAYRDWETCADIYFNKFKKELKLNNKYIKLDEPSYEAQYRYKIKLNLSDKRKDISNFSKALKDWLKGKIYIEDKWVDLEIQLPVIVDRNTKIYTILIKSKHI
jgi:Holliday junction resolvase RusA-like endonuclease